MADDLTAGTSSSDIEEIVENTARLSAPGYDVRASASLVGLACAQRDMTVDKSAMVVANIDGNARIDKSFAEVLVAGDVTGENFGTAVLVSRAAEIKRGWVGIAVAPGMTVSEDSKVIIGPKAALIIAVALLGVAGLALVFVYEAASRMARWRPSVPSVHWRRWGD